MKNKNLRVAVVGYVGINGAFKTYKQAESPIYNYACFDDDLKVGDYALVITRGITFNVVKIKSFVENTEKYTNELICKINLEPYVNNLNKQKKKQEILSEIKSLAKDAQEITLYKTLADHDPEIKSLLDEYESLTKED